MSGLHPAPPRRENITGTIAELPVPVTAESRGADAAQRCGYVVASGWRYGAPDPFCGAPAAPGSSYCARHRSLCAVDPATPTGRRLARHQAAAARAALPAGFPPLAAPEPLPDPEGIEALAELDLPAPSARPLADDPA